MTERIIDTTVREASADLQRRGLKPLDRVTIIIQPEEHPFMSARVKSRALVAAAGLTDDDIDKLIEQARDEIAAAPR